MADRSAPHGPTPSRPLLQSIFNDHLLLGAFVCCALLFGYQLTVTLLQPPWIESVTDRLRTGLAWPQFLVVAWVAMHLFRTHQPGAVTWCCGALGMLSYAVARTLWTIADMALSPQGVPFPSLPDVFFLLQYPCFFLALVFTPALALGHRLPGVRVLLDGLLWMSAITALVWYFVLLPISLQAGEPLLAKQISMVYQVGDLVLIYGLVIALARPQPRSIRFVLGLMLLSLAAVSLFIGDTWATVLLFHPPQTFRGGSAPALFRFLCYLLIPLGALVRLRLTPAELPPRVPGPFDHLTRREVLAGIQFVAPSVAVVMAGMVIILTATLRAHGTESLLLAPEVVGSVLLLLALLRPVVLFLEQEQLRRERDAARAQERAVRLAQERMEAFLSLVAHELRTPLTSLIGNVHLLVRRVHALVRPDARREDYTRSATVLGTLLEYCEQSLHRMERLVEDVLDETRVRQGRLALRLQPCELTAVVGEAVAEQMALNPDRIIRWDADAVTPASVPVLADASRIAQVVTNLVSNALKFSRTDQAVEVRLRTKDTEQEQEQEKNAMGVAQVSIHDDGVGIPVAEQPHIWEQFYQAEGAQVQSGSQVGVGMGLYISKAIVEGHHGRVGVESVPQQGTTVWFVLPLASPLVSPSSEAGAGSPASPPSPPRPGEHEREREQRKEQNR